MLLPQIDENDPHQVASREVWLQVLSQPMYSSSKVREVLRARSKLDNAAELRKSGKLLGIWDGQEFRYPAWQFVDGVLDERVASLLDMLPPQLEDKAGWRRALWLAFPNELLDDRVPMDIWRDHADFVIDAAREEFGPKP